MTTLASSTSTTRKEEGKTLIKTATKWSFNNARRDFENARGDWDALNRFQFDHVLLDSGFVAPLLKYFGSDRVLLGRPGSGRQGMLLVEKSSFGCWETFQPSQAPLGLFVAGSADNNTEYFREILDGLPGIALQFAMLQQDPDFSAFSPQLANPTLEVMDFVDTARLRVDGSFEDFWNTRSADLRQNLMRRMRRLEKQGRRLGMTTITEPDQVADAIQAYGRMESQGWKGRAGTAITTENDQARFYREVMETFCARGEGYIYQVHLDDQIVGSELYIGRKGMLVGLKTTFDEALREISPGFLMKYLILRQVFAEKRFHTVEFYGRVHDWHSKWATDIRKMYHFNYFRNSWIRKAREIVKEFRAARQARG